MDMSEEHSDQRKNYVDTTVKSILEAMQFDSAEARSRCVNSRHYDGCDFRTCVYMFCGSVSVCFASCFVSMFDERFDVHILANPNITCSGYALFD